MGPTGEERADLESVRQRHLLTLDEARPDAVARRRERGRRTARENVADLLDEGTFVEYGPLIFAAQERRRDKQELIERTPADGLVGGVGEIEGERCVAMSYDYTVLAGTQGIRNHAKKDRLFELAERRRLPVVLFAEGGGGRPGDVDMPIVAGLDCRAFALFARLSGLVPLVGIASGYCFAGNAGRPPGVVPNDPKTLGGAIDADGADKAARFVALCDAFALPVLFLCDTPGFMVGPAAERTATVRHFARMFLAGANLSVPCGTIVLRKGYGLGAQAMAGGGFKAPLFTVGWPTPEFGGMGLEGAVRLGMRRELDAIDDPDERERAYQAAVAAAYERGRGLNMAAYGEIDDVIDPADSRRWIAQLFGAPARREGKHRPYVDAW